MRSLIILEARGLRIPLQEVTKEVVGIHVLLTRSLFGDGIPRSLLLRVSLAKPTFAALRFLCLRKTKLQFGSPQRRQSLETHHGVGAVRHTIRALQIFRPLFPPRLLPQELPRYDPLARCKASAFSTRNNGRLIIVPVEWIQCSVHEYLPLCHPKCCTPSRGV